MIEKEGDAFKIADAVEEDTTLKLCYNPDNFKYDARARDNVGYLIGRGGEDWEFRAELRVGSPNGPRSRNGTATKFMVMIDTKTTMTAKRSRGRKVIF